MKSVMRFILNNFELLFWITALILLYGMNTDTGKNSFCIFNLIGFTWCPGCGIGHSIQSALHLQFMTSIDQHPLGILAVIIILYRIKQLSFTEKQLVS
ncbi:MAG: DUF2752 domain-containing protein [Ferruginibacter sp.]